ncbi:MAG TPA: Ig-like domain-containing protein [Nitrospirota bacterium]|nr:Ig-like domain-containing protein [Nitrospirota bacterium]
MNKSLWRIIHMTVFAIVTLAGCGGGGGSPSAPSDQWGKISAINNQSNRVSISGTAWVSSSWVGLHCFGIGCLFENNFDDYPGVDVTYTNLTTGASGKATSYYGGGTNWVHEWYAIVPIVPGENAIQISAYDPSGKGGDIDTINVYDMVVYLELVSCKPSNGALQVPVNATISATFSEPLDPLTVNASSFLISGPSWTVAGSILVSGPTATFTPNESLAYNGTYTITITTSVKDIWGSSLSSDVVWIFSTGSTLDNIPPSAPSGLNATAVDAGSVDLSWKAFTNNVMFSPLQVLNMKKITAIPAGDVHSYYSKGINPFSHQQGEIIFEPVFTRSSNKSGSSCRF